MRRLYAVVVVAALLVGCSAAPTADAPRVVRVVMADDWVAAPAFRDAVATFEVAHPGVEVQVQPAPFSQIPDLVRNAAELGQPFDLAHWHAFSAAAAGMALPLDDLWAEAGLTPEEYLPGAVDDVTWEGQRFGVPLDVNALVLMVNERHLEAAGVELSDLEDLDGFVDVARRLVASGASDHAVTSSVSVWAAYGWVRAFGGRLVRTGADGEVEFTFDDPAAVAALDLWATLASEGLITPPFAEDQAIDAIQYLTSGAAAIHPTGSWDLAIAGRANEVTLDDIAVVPLPRGEGDTGTVLGGSSLFVPVGAAEPQLAFDLALSVTEDEVALRLADEEGRLPARPRVYDGAPTFAQRPAWAEVVAELPQADVLELYAYPTLLEGFRSALESVLRQQQDAATALRELQTRAEEAGATGPAPPETG